MRRVVHLRSEDNQHQNGSVSTEAFTGPVLNRPVAALSVDDAASQAPSRTSLSGYFIDASAPFPQDTPLTKIPAVAALIADGDVTDQDLAYSLGGLSEQQGNYAGIALRYLGLAGRDSTTSPSTLYLTPAGESFAASTPEEQYAILCHLVGQIDESQLFARDYADSTATYRENTLEGWRKALDNAALFGVERAAAEQDVLARSADPNRPARAVPVPRYPEPKPVSVCQGCNEALPATGVCDWC